MRKRGRYERQKPKRRAGSVVLIVLITLLVLILAAGIAGVIYYNAMLNKMNHVEVPKIQYTEEVTEAVEETVAAEETKETEEATEAPTETVYVPSPEDYVNILLVGQASREGEAERFADTMILVTLNKHEKTINLTSFLRDSLVNPPSFRNKQFGNIKLTTVYHLGSYYDNGNVAGSMELMNATLYKNFGVEVDYNFEVDFDAFMQVVNLLGGISVELTQAEADYLNSDENARWVQHEMNAGMQHMYGNEALCYARMRKAEGDGDSDITRTERQRKVISAILSKVKTRSVSELQNLVNEVLPYITTSMTNAEITDMIMTMIPMLTELKIESSGTCPVEGTYKGEMYVIYKEDGQEHSILRFNPEEQKKLMRAITEGEIAE